jgi:hypothetical protein
VNQGEANRTEKNQKDEGPMNGGHPEQFRNIPKIKQNRYKNGYQSPLSDRPCPSTYHPFLASITTWSTESSSFVL